jgi:hypothetical protein
MKLAAAILAICLIAASATPAGAQPAPGSQVRVQLAPPPDAESASKAREIVEILYHGDAPGDMDDWLFEHLMDRYRRAFDLADPADDPAIKAAIHDELSSVQQRLRPIATRHAPAIRAGMVDELASRFRGHLDDLVAFAHTAGGRRYFETYTILIADRPALRGLVAENTRLAVQVNAELAERAPRYVKAHPELAAAVLIAAGALQ